MRLVATCVSALGVFAISAPALAGPAVSIGSISYLELQHRVKQDAYFTRNAPLGKRLRIEYDGCGYRIHVGEHSATSRDGDLLVVDRHGRVTRVVHQR
jgi:hypothetical protein